jgi:tetratricopeptide (TPR) repeat protein
LITGIIVLLAALVWVVRIILTDIQISHAFELLAKGRPTEASLIFKNWMSVRSRSVTCRWGLAKAAFSERRFHEALSFIRTIPQADVRTSGRFTFMDFYLFLADIHTELAQYEDAVKYLIYLKKSGYDLWKVNFLIGEKFYLDNDPRKAARYLNEAVKQNPNAAMCWSLLGIISYEGRNYKSAIYYLQKTLTKDRLDNTARLYLGFSYYRTEQFAQAAGMLKDIEPPNDLRHTYDLMAGMSFYKTFDYMNSYTCLNRYRKVLKKNDPNYPEIIYRLASSCEQIGRFNEAASLWHELVSSAPNYLDVMRRSAISGQYAVHEGFKIFLFSRSETWRSIMAIMVELMGFKTEKTEMISDSVAEIITEKRQKDDGTFDRTLYKFVRSFELSDMIDQKVVELFYHKMKTFNCTEGVIATVGAVTPEVEKYLHVYSIRVMREDELVPLIDQAFQKFKTKNN